MGRPAHQIRPRTTLEEWRYQRQIRARKAHNAEMRRSPKGIRPGGNGHSTLDQYVDFDAPVETPASIPKHVPQNTHRAGSIAYALLYHYVRPGE